MTGSPSSELCHAFRIRRIADSIALQSLVVPADVARQDQELAALLDDNSVRPSPLGDRPLD